MIENYLDARGKDVDAERVRSTATSCLPPLSVLVSPETLEHWQADGLLDLGRFLRGTNVVVVTDLEEADDADTNPLADTKEEVAAEKPVEQKVDEVEAKLREIEARLAKAGIAALTAAEAVAAEAVEVKP